jgi:hypothetical protein
MEKGVRVERVTEREKERERESQGYSFQKRKPVSHNGLSLRWLGGKSWGSL